MSVELGEEGLVKKRQWMGMALFTGYILDATGSYSLLFAICAGAYFMALLAVHLLSPKLERVTVAG